MAHQAFVDLLTDLHQSIDLLAQDLARDRPALARALLRRTAWIPRPDDVAGARPPPDDACGRLGPLLYRALDEGVIDAAGFDALMLGRSRAARALRER